MLHVLLALLTYVIFLCLEIIGSQPRVKIRIAKVPQPVGSVPAAEPSHDLIPAKVAIVVEEATDTGRDSKSQ